MNCILKAIGIEESNKRQTPRCRYVVATVCAAPSGSSLVLTLNQLVGRVSRVSRVCEKEKKKVVMRIILLR